MTGKITTHVLDLSLGMPAIGVMVELWQVEGENTFTMLTISMTNEDGRVSQPLLEGNSMKKGTYEIRFQVGEYYRGRGSTQVVFLECVPIRFEISEPTDHYHVPLLVSPGGYSTYRGS